MPILNRVNEMQEEIAGWRRHLHQTPELLYDVEETAAFAAGKLKAFGCDVVRTGIGRTGVVGLIKGSRGHGRAADTRDQRQAVGLADARQDARLRP